MASSDDTDAPAGTGGPADTAGSGDVPCSACRGTGRVISNLGGTPHEIACPWCGGGGRRLPDHDAQAPGGAERAEAPSGGDGGGDDEGGGPDLAA